MLSQNKSVQENSQVSFSCCYSFRDTIQSQKQSDLFSFISFLLRRVARWCLAGLLFVIIALPLPITALSLAAPDVVKWLDKNKLPDLNCHLLAL